MENYLLDDFLRGHLATVHFPELRNVQQTLFSHVNKQFLEYFRELSSMGKITLTFFVPSQACLNCFSINFNVKSGLCVNVTRAFTSS
jgi:hypothetical protein